MSDFRHLAQGITDTQIFIGGSTAAGSNWSIWQRPLGKTMAMITLIGQGGGGGTGVVGAVSVSAGGAGGGSGAISKLLVPLAQLPEQLYISCGSAPTGAGIAGYVSIRPNTTVNHLLLFATGGPVGGNAAAGVGGTIGTAAAIATLGSCPLAMLGITTFLAGVQGVAGGAAIAGAFLTLPTTGQMVTGGTGGAGLGATASVGTSGGSFTVPAAPSPFPPQPGGVGGSTATTPPQVGQNGCNNVIQGLFYSYGGTGGGSTHGSATGAGLVQARGGDGGWGCGGGGMGGAFTGSTASVASKGGDGICIITCW
jgi:hypothetical protein